MSIFIPARVVLPCEFIPTKYPGYFWNDVDKKLYSCKSGSLKPIKGEKPNYHNGWESYGYKVSVQGRRRILWLHDLEKLQRHYAVFPIEGVVN